jgi:hypothetical protein
MMTVLSPHWKVLVTLLKMLMFSSCFNSWQRTASIGLEGNSEHDAIPVKPHADQLQWNDTASLCFAAGKVKNA